MAQFPLQFGREVLAGKALLNCEERVDWRAIGLTKAKETELAEALKTDFRPFDFTAEDDNDLDI